MQSYKSKPDSLGHFPRAPTQADSTILAEQFADFFGVFEETILNIYLGRLVS